MISVFIWVYFLIGDPLAHEHGTPYIQVEASQMAHDNPSLRDRVERQAHRDYDYNYPGHPVCDGGWCRQEVKVWQA